MRVRNGAIPLLSRHVERLVGSCPRANLLPPPRDLGEHAEAHALRPPADRVLRVEWNGATLTWDDREYRLLQAIRLRVSPELHPGYPIKSAERGAFDRAQADAERHEADEALLLTAAGYVAETARFSIAWFEGDGLLVPDPRLDILPSVGRIRLMELAEIMGIRVELGAWPLEALTGRPALLVNAVRGVVPVSSVDGQALPRHPAFGQLADAFWPSA